MSKEEKAKLERRFNWLFSELKLLQWQLEHGGRSSVAVHVGAANSCLEAGHHANKLKDKEESFKG